MVPWRWAGLLQGKIMYYEKLNMGNDPSDGFEDTGGYIAWTSKQQVILKQNLADNQRWRHSGPRNRLLPMATRAWKKILKSGKWHHPPHIIGSAPEVLSREHSWLLTCKIGNMVDPWEVSELWESGHRDTTCFLLRGAGSTQHSTVDSVCKLKGQNHV